MKAFTVKKKKRERERLTVCHRMRNDKIVLEAARLIRAL
jgi:hypothetical protein